MPDALCLPALVAQLVGVSKNPVEGVPAHQHPPQAHANTVNISAALVVGRGQPDGVQEGEQLL